MELEAKPVETPIRAATQLSNAVHECLRWKSPVQLIVVKTEAAALRLKTAEYGWLFADSAQIGTKIDGLVRQKDSIGFI